MANIIFLGFMDSSVTNARYSLARQGHQGVYRGFMEVIIFLKRRSRPPASRKSRRHEMYEDYLQNIMKTATLAEDEIKDEDIPKGPDPPCRPETPAVEELCVLTSGRVYKMIQERRLFLGGT